MLPLKSGTLAAARAAALLPCTHQLPRFFSDLGGGDFRRPQQPPEAPASRPKTSEDVHGVLREEDVSSKAMRRKLARAQPFALQATPATEEAPPPPHAAPPSFLQFMMTNVVMGIGMTLGFMAVAAAIRAVMGVGSTARPPPARPLQQPRHDAYAADTYDTSSSSKQRASETRI